MMLWFILALMTIAAIFAVLWPLGRAAPEAAAGGDTAIYRDQIEEIERDLALNLIDAKEAEAARVEVSRRLLAAAAVAPVKANPNRTVRRAVVLIALIALPVFSGALYYRLGTPEMPSFPLAERKGGGGAESLERLVAKVEAHLEKNPEDGRGWHVLGPALMNLDRFDDAVKAFRNAIKYNEETAARRADLGEALMAVAGGIVSADAKTEFARATELEPSNPKANYFLGLAAQQDGRPKDAVAIWRKLLTSSPEDAPWRGVVEAALARVGGDGKVAGPTEEEMAAATKMSAEDRDAMIKAMVDRLATRLKQDGSDVQGWLRLVRTYMVLGDTAKARAAVADARKAVEANAESLRLLNDGLKSLGVDG